MKGDLFSVYDTVLTILLDKIINNLPFVHRSSKMEFTECSSVKFS